MQQLPYTPCPASLPSCVWIPTKRQRRRLADFLGLGTILRARRRPPPPFPPPQLPPLQQPPQERHAQQAQPEAAPDATAEAPPAPAAARAARLHHPLRRRLRLHLPRCTRLRRRRPFTFLWRLIVSPTRVLSLEHCQMLCVILYIVVPALLFRWGLRTHGCGLLLAVLRTC